MFKVSKRSKVGNGKHEQAGKKSKPVPEDQEPEVPRVG